MDTELEFASVSAGGRHACALTAAGEAYCWGTNDFGRLGSLPSDGRSGDPRPIAGPLP